MTFNVHEPLTPMSEPPPRTILSGSSSITENIGIYVRHNLNKWQTNMIPTCKISLFSFFKLIDEIFKGPKLPDNALLVTMDVSAAYMLAYVCIFSKYI